MCPSAEYQEGSTVTIIDAKLFLSIISVCQDKIHDTQRSKAKKSCPRLFNWSMHQFLLSVICCYGWFSRLNCRDSLHCPLLLKNCFPLRSCQTGKPRCSGGRHNVGRHCAVAAKKDHEIFEKSCAYSFSIINAEAKWPQRSTPACQAAHFKPTLSTFKSF